MNRTQAHLVNGAVICLIATLGLMCGSVVTRPAWGAPETDAASSHKPAQITILYDAFGKTSAMKKDWGFSAYIEYGGKKILFDTGNNADIISHRHGDHTSGLNYLLKVNPSVKIYAPQENFGVFGAALPGTFYRRDEALPTDMRYFDGTPPEKLRFGSAWPEGNFTGIKNDTEIAPGFHIIALTGNWGADFELREISLAMDTPEGIVLVVGCSHPTIEKIVQQTKATLNKPIHLVFGGLHLLPAKDDQIKAIASFLHDAKVEFIAPAHCTGEPAFGILKESFRDDYVYTGLGSTTVVGEKVTVKAEAGEPAKYAMDREDYQSYRAALAQGPYRSLLGSRNPRVN